MQLSSTYWISLHTVYFVCLFASTLATNVAVRILLSIAHSILVVALHRPCYVVSFVRCEPHLRDRSTRILSARLLFLCTLYRCLLDCPFLAVSNWNVPYFTFCCTHRYFFPNINDPIHLLGLRFGCSAPISSVSVHAYDDKTTPDHAISPEAVVRLGSQHPAQSVSVHPPSVH